MPPTRPRVVPGTSGGIPLADGGRAKASPLTDWRSLAISLGMNGVLLLAASLLVLGVRPPAEPPPSRVLNGEIGPVDNRAPDEPTGGSPGADGGTGIEIAAERARPDRPTIDRSRDRDAADAILAEVLPPPRREVEPQALPGPSLDGLGLVAGPGLGGGGGVGVGSGGGDGRGDGPGTEFFGLRDRARSYAYVIDCSGSMSTAAGSGGRTVLDVAKRELLTSLEALPPEAKFAVIFYNLDATVFTDPSGRRALMTASPSNKARVRSRIGEITAIGGTDHMQALREALKLGPEVIFFLTDADLMTRTDADEVRRDAQTSRLQAVEFGIGPSVRGSDPLRWLAENSGGSYRYLDVRTYRPASR